MDKAGYLGQVWDTEYPIQVIFAYILINPQKGKSPVTY